MGCECSLDCTVCNRRMCLIPGPTLPFCPHAHWLTPHSISNRQVHSNFNFTPTASLTVAVSSTEDVLLDVSVAGSVTPVTRLSKTRSFPELSPSSTQSLPTWHHSLAESVSPPWNTSPPRASTGHGPQATESSSQCRPWDIESFSKHHVYNKCQGWTRSGWLNIWISFKVSLSNNSKDTCTFGSNYV